LRGKPSKPVLVRDKLDEICESKPNEHYTYVNECNNIAVMLV
jgi:hypothetical protein